jgi:hypothetical protein
MTAADQIVRSAKKVLAMEGRPHMTTFAPILMSFSFRLVSDQSSHGEVRVKAINSRISETPIAVSVSKV